MDKMVFLILFVCLGKPQFSIKMQFSSFWAPPLVLGPNKLSKVKREGICLDVDKG
jgi:hypothetical protein